MAVNVKMGVDLSGFTSGIKEGQGILKGLAAEMKAIEAEFNRTGDAEKALADKTKNLSSQINVQKGIMDQAAKALKTMTESGINPADAAYQRMFATLQNATAGMNDAQAQLASLGEGSKAAAEGADQLGGSLEKISKKISLDQVIKGIDKITDGLENAAKKAVSLGQDLWENIMNAAKWADDTQTQANMYGIDVETFQRMQKLVTNGLDTTVDAVLKSQQKMRKGLGEGNKSVMETFEQLRITTREWGQEQGQSGPSLVLKDQEKLFWEAGQAIMNMTDAYKQEAAAQTLFGRSWRDLVPLFETYKTLDEYNAALEDTKINSEEDVDALADLNDKVAELKGNFETLSRDVMAQLAPALTEAANALNGLLTSLMDYLETEDGQKMLESLGTAVSGLFDDLGKINAKDVIDNFTTVFTGLVDGLKWVADNKDTVVHALEGVLIGWGALEVTGGALTVLQLIQGITGLGASGAAQAAGAAGAAAGSSWGAGFASAVAKAAPWLIGVYELLNPSNTGDAQGNNDITGENGELTVEGQQARYQLDPEGNPYLDRRKIMEEAAQEAWDLTRTQQFDRAALDAPREKIMDDAAFQSLVDHFMKTREENPGSWMNLEDIDLTEWLAGLEPPPIEIKPEVPAGASGDIANQIGPVSVPVTLTVSGGLPGNLVYALPKANGIPFVPYDGYLASLHRGERVVPAREVSSRNFSSNLYVENMNMNGGLSADALAARIAGQNRRIMAGYGS